jgi:hypothetical protein
MPLVKTAPKPPPRRTPRETAPQVPARQTRAQKRYEGLQGISQFAGVFCLSRGWYADAGAIGIHGPGLCREAVNIAEMHEPVGKVLDYLAEAGPYTGFVLALVKLGAQIAANHNMVNPEKMTGLDVMPPELLEARAKREFLELQKLAEEEQRKLAEEMAAASRNGDSPS